MKISIFNLYIKSEKEHQFILYNTLAGSISVIDEDMKNALKRGYFDSLKESHLKSLKKFGFIVQEDVNEEAIYEYEIKSKIFNPLEYEFSILLTYDCNLFCPYCRNCMQNIQTMDENVTEDTISFIKMQTVKSGRKYLNIRLFGGEPLLHPELGLKILKELSEWSKSQNIIFNGALITNGTLVSREMINKLSPYLSVVQLTLEGPREYHDKIRRYKDGRGTYDKILDTLRLLQDLEVLVFLRLHISPENFDELGKLFTDLTRKGFKDLRLRLAIHPIVEEGSICSFYPLSCAAGEKHTSLLPEAWKTAIENGFNVITKPVSNHIILSCPFASNYSVIIDPSGNVYKCLRLVGREDRRTGQVSEEVSFLNASYELIDFMSHHNHNQSSCRICSYLPLCNGGCAHNPIESNTQCCIFSKELSRKKILTYIKQHSNSAFKDVLKTES